jgi:hypothetical protein
MKWKDLPSTAECEFTHELLNDEKITDEFFDQKQAITN